MTDSNRLRVAVVRETSLGVPPATPTLRTARITSDGISWQPQYFTPAELRSDRMSPDPTKINETTGGPLPFEFSYPVDKSFLSEVYASAFFNDWTKTPQRANDGTADSVITDIGTTANTVTCTTGAAFVIGHLVKTSGNAVAANNTVAKVTTGGTTSFVSTSAGYTAETAPPAASRAKVVGIEGASGDIVATATGLTSTVMDFTAMGFFVGMWMKIGGSTSGQKFATAANNAWVRATAVAANAITLDNLPSGWGADTGTSKTIRIFFGDYLRNGLNSGRISLAIERGFLDQATPTYVWHLGMVANTLNLTMSDGQAVTGSVEFMGLSSSQGTTANGATYEAAPRSDLYPVMTSNVSVGSIAEAGSAMASPNWARNLSIQFANNLRPITAIGTVGAVEMGLGEVGVTGTLETYFGSNALLTKLMAGTASSLSSRIVGNSQAVIWTLPRVFFTAGSPNAGGKNQSVMLPLQFVASIDPTTNCEIDLQRIEYYE